MIQYQKQVTSILTYCSKEFVSVQNGTILWPFLSFLSLGLCKQPENRICCCLMFAQINFVMVLLKFGTFLKHTLSCFCGNHLSVIFCSFLLAKCLYNKYLYYQKFPYNEVITEVLENFLWVQCIIKTADLIFE